MDKHISLARELGYEGQELRDYLKRQQDLESEERLAQREYEKEKKEVEQKDKEREEKEKDREQKDKDRELEKLRIEAEKLKIEAARKDKEMEMEKEIALKKIEAEVELKKIEAETTSHPWGPKEKSSNPRSPKLPYFDEHTDKMDSYLTRFESYALSNKWDPSMWASYLSALLKGRALEVFVRLSRDDQSDYGQIKEALLTNFDLTERSFLARDQFLDCCSHELYLYLKPKTFKALGELAHEADLFADARGGVPGCVAKGHRETKSQVPHNYGNQVDRKSNISCKICGKAHQTHNCWHNKSKRVSAGTEIASSAEFNSPNQGGKWQNRGRNWNRGRNNYRRNQSAPGRNSNRNYNNDKVDHQVNFCKVKGEQSTDKGVHSVYHAKMHDPIDNYKENPHKDSKGTCYFLRSRLPTAVGTVNGKEVRVLRDTGCTGVVVRRDLVSDEQMLGKELDVTLINESKLKYPVARISVECPFFNGTTEALCMEDTLYDLVIGNIDGSKLPDMSHFAASVVTRSQAKKTSVHIKNLKSQIRLSIVIGMQSSWIRLQIQSSQIYGSE